MTKETNQEVAVQEDTLPEPMSHFIIITFKKKGFFKKPERIRVTGFDIYGVNSGLLLLKYSDGTCNHINLDLVSSFQYFPQ